MIDTPVLHPPSSISYIQHQPNPSLKQHCYIALQHTFTMSSDAQAPSNDIADDEYQSRTGQSEIPVVKDSKAVESTEYDNGGDSDEQLGMFSPYSFYNIC